VWIRFPPVFNCEYCPAGLLSWLSRWSITLNDEYTLYTEEEEKEKCWRSGNTPPEPQIEFVIKVLFMTPNYVPIIITKFHTIYMAVLDI
jgi:hypothetical protein